MIKKADILKIARTILKGRQTRKNKLRSPARDWFVGLSVAFVVTAGVVSYDVILFSFYSSPETVVEHIDMDGVNFKQSLANEVIDLYSNKEEEFERLRGFAPDPISVSVPDSGNDTRSIIDDVVAE